MSGLSRRQFVQGAGLASVGLLAGCGQLPWQSSASPKMWRIGFLTTNPKESNVPPTTGSDPTFDAFKEGLREYGYSEPQNLVIEYRSAGQDADNVREVAAELVRLQVDLILASGFAAARAAKDVTSTIPIVIGRTNDPVAAGLVSSLARPGGNVTGLSLMAPQLSAKRLELLKDAVPSVNRVGVLVDTVISPTAERDWGETQLAARSLGLELLRLDVQRPEEIDSAFESAAHEGAEAILPLATSVFALDRARIIQLAAKYRLPGMYEHRDFTNAGGLMSYGPNLSALAQRSAYYVDRIFRGANPADLPIEQPMRFDFVLNLKTARDLGLTISESVLVQVTEVVE